MNGPPRRMRGPSLWPQFAVLTFIVGFAVLSYRAYGMYAEHPPIPQRVLTEDGTGLVTGDDIMAGQQIFQTFGLMQFGTLLPVELRPRS